MSNYSQFNPNTNGQQPYTLYGAINNSPDINNFPPDLTNKLYYFPTTPDEHPQNYPDITAPLNRFKNNMVQDIWNMRDHSGFMGITDLFQKNFPNGQPWDTKSLFEFPGRGYGGKEQLARYHGVIVPGSYIANNTFGSASAAVGFPLETALGIANIARLHSEGKMDQPEDQWSIISGYSDYKYGNPWRYGKYSLTRRPNTNDVMNAWRAYRFEHPIENETHSPYFDVNPDFFSPGL